MNSLLINAEMQSPKKLITIQLPLSVANKVMTDSNLCIVMVDGQDLDSIQTRPAAIIDVLNREAGHAMDLKKLEL